MIHEGNAYAKAPGRKRNLMSKSMKRKKHVARWIVAGLVLLAAAACLSVNIRQITVTGNKRYTAEQIESLLFSGKWDRNTAYCLYKDRFQKHQQIPFVEDYKIVFQSPTKVEVIVYEKSIVGYVTYMGSYMYFDKDGIVVESASSKLEGVPWVTGLQFGHIVLHQPLPVEDSRIFGQILGLTQALSNFQIKVDKIQYDENRKATLTMGNIQVVLGDYSQMNGKVERLHDMLPVLKGLSGTLFLDNFDENNPGKPYRFVEDK